MGKSSIHPAAIIDRDARIGRNVSIGPYTIIGAEVSIGDNTTIENHVTLKGKTTIGESNTIGPYTSIGLAAQDKAHRDEPAEVIIGDNNDIREYVSIHRGTSGGTGITRVGNHNQIMVGVHFAHDTRVGDHCMLANSTILAGHVIMGSYVVTGGMSGFHQFCRIGDYAMLGGHSVAYQDICPYTLCTGSRAILLGLNLTGLERNGFTTDEISRIQKMYSTFFDDGLVPGKAIEIIKKETPDGLITDRFIKFVTETKRGIISKA